MDSLDELTKEQAAEILRKVAQIDSKVFDLAIARFNIDELARVTAEQDAAIEGLNKELAQLRGEPEDESVKENADT